MSEGEIVLQSICAGTLSLDHTCIGFSETLTNLYDLKQYFHRKIRLSTCHMNSFSPLQPFISLFTPNAIFKMCFKMFQVCIIIHVTIPVSNSVSYSVKISCYKIYQTDRFYNIDQ